MIQIAAATAPRHTCAQNLCPDPAESSEPFFLQVELYAVYAIICFTGGMLHDLGNVVRESITDNSRTAEQQQVSLMRGLLYGVVRAQLFLECVSLVE